MTPDIVIYHDPEMGHLLLPVAQRAVFAKEDGGKAIDAAGSRVTG